MDLNKTIKFIFDSSIKSANGVSNKEIAEGTGVSVSTVDRHLNKEWQKHRCRRVRWEAGHLPQHTFRRGFGPDGVLMIYFPTPEALEWYLADQQP